MAYFNSLNNQVTMPLKEEKNCSADLMLVNNSSYSMFVRQKISNGKCSEIGIKHDETCRPKNKTYEKKLKTQHAKLYHKSL